MEKGYNAEPVKEKQEVNESINKNEYVQKPLTEKEKKEEYLRKLNELPPEERASLEFNKLLPEYKRAIGRLSVRGANRVSAALVEFPLQSKYPNFNNKKDELYAFRVGVMLQENKIIMMNSVLMTKVLKHLTPKQQESLKKKITEENRKTEEKQLKMKQMVIKEAQDKIKNDTKENVNE